MTDRSQMPTADVAAPPPVDDALRPAPSQDAASRPRLDSLDGLRGIAALGILVLHVWMFSYGDTHRTDKGALDLLIGELRVGVALFFVLSGYLLFRPFVAAALDGGKAPGLGRYALRRAARILPAYWAAVIGSFLLLRHFEHPMGVNPDELLLFFVFAQNHFEETIKHLDPPLWTLAVEASFYVALPVLGWLALRLGRDRRRQVALCLALVAAGTTCTVLAATTPWPRTLSTSLLPHLGEFGAGMAVAAIMHGRRLSPRAARAAMLAGVLLIVANGAWHAYGVGPQLWRSVVADVPGVAGMALVLAPLVAVSGWRAPALAWGPVKWLGTLSYGVYLVHFPVIVALRATDRWPETLPRQLAAVTLITLAIAAVLWVVVERPAIRWARRVTTPTRRPHRAPTPRRTAQPARAQA